jgi:hypothetical protein
MVIIFDEYERVKTSVLMNNSTGSRKFEEMHGGICLENVPHVLLAEDKEV